MEGTNNTSDHNTAQNNHHKQQLLAPGMNRILPATAQAEGSNDTSHHTQLNTSQAQSSYCTYDSNTTNTLRRTAKPIAQVGGATEQTKQTTTEKLTFPSGSHW